MWKMRTSLTVICLLLVLAATGAAQGQSLPAGVKVTGYTTYRIQAVTSLVVPNGNVQSVRVWHAIPDVRLWSNTGKVLGATDIAYDPTDSGSVKLDTGYGSHSIFWIIHNPYSGQSLSFTSIYTVRSADRTFDPNSVTTNWPQNFTPPNDVNPMLASVADQIRQSDTPSVAVLDFCKWIANYLTYDASVYNASADQIVERRRGYCGNYALLLDELCRRVGIKAHMVWGLDLYQPDGIGHLQSIRPDWTNIHTWSEVYFPEVGWVEVNPTTGSEAYSIPASCIQDNVWYQNYAIWANENGVDKYVDYTYTDGKYSSEFQVSHITSYQIVSHS